MSDSDMEHTSNITISLGSADVILTSETFRIKDSTMFGFVIVGLEN